MFDEIIAFLSGAPKPGEPDLRVAVAALLVEAAWTTDGFAAAERARIEGLLTARFGLTPEETRSLLEAGERAGRSSTHMLRFTRSVLEGMSEPEREELIEMLWDVAYADGQLDPEEEHLIVKIAGLLFVSPSARNAARRRAQAKAGIAGPA